VKVNIQLIDEKYRINGRKHMQCEVCGRPLRGPSFLVEIDGATLRVCSSCTK
jgi:hypothetical protein